MICAVGLEENKQTNKQRVIEAELKGKTSVFDPIGNLRAQSVDRRLKISSGTTQHEVKGGAIKRKQDSRAVVHKSS